MQKMLTDTVTSALAEKDKTKQTSGVKKSQSFKILNYQQGSNRDNNTINIKTNKGVIDDNVRPRERRK